MIRVKVCGMTSRENISEVCGAEPDFMGFIFYPASSRYIGNAPDISLFESILPGIIPVGVFVNEHLNIVTDMAERTGIKLIQLHGEESPDYCYKLISRGLEIIKAFKPGKSFKFDNVSHYLPVCKYFLFDTDSAKPGGSGEKFNWEQLGDYEFNKPFFLAGGIGPGDAGSVKKLVSRGLFAVDINSRFEASPGIKNVSLVKTFIKEIKNSDYGI